MDNPSPPERDVKQAILLGLRCRCPACGNAPLFGRYLKILPHCPACGQDWTHQRADDLPAYIVILLLGHIIVPAMVEVERAFSPPLMFQMLFWPGLAIVLALLLLQPVKGAVVAIQWARHMHGFAPVRPGTGHIVD